MNVINAVRAPPGRSNGPAPTGHSAAAAVASTSSGGYYTSLPAQGGSSGSCSSSTSSASSETSEEHNHRHQLSYPELIIESPRHRWSQENGSPSASDLDDPSSTGAAMMASCDKTDSKFKVYVNASPSSSSPSDSSTCLSPTSSSSLNLSIGNAPSPGPSSATDFDDNYLYAVQSLEHDLDCILENRDLNPFYEDVGVAGGSGSPLCLQRVSGEEEEAVEFNVEDYLVDLDQYLDEEEQRTVIGQVDPSTASSTLDRRIIRKPNTNQTLPRNLKDDLLKRDPATRKSMHLGKEPDGSSSTPKRRSLWLRNSMRKTKLIPLPNQRETVLANGSGGSSQEGEGSSLVTYAPEQLDQSPVSTSRNLQTVSNPPAPQSGRNQQASRTANENNLQTMDHVSDFMAFNRVTFQPNLQAQPQQRPVIHNDERQRTSEPGQSQVVRQVPIIRTDGDFAYLSGDNSPSAPVLEIPYQAPPPPPPPMTIPRQLGRRSELHPRIVAINAESNTIVVSHHDNHSRPTSAPARVGFGPTAATENATGGRENRRGTEFESMSSVGSSRNPSPVSLLSSSGSSMASANDSQERTAAAAEGVTSSRTAAAADPQNEPNHSTVTDRRSHRTPSEQSQEDIEAKNKMWPHDLGSALAIISCTLGVFNISRFAVLSVHFGANFIVQFLILSAIFGVPMLWLQMCLGAKIQRGPVGMWKISPISRGIGIVLLLVQGLIGLYSAISISWLLVYFRDAFVSNADHFKWQEPVEMYRPGGMANDSITLAETIPDYFNGIVLQRYNLGPAGRVAFSTIGKVRFQLAFNLSLFWTFVFIILCRGLRSYGKFVFPLVILPVVGLTAFSTKLLMMIDFSSIENLFPATDWDDFFVNSNSWMSAAQETFLTWGLFGASVLSISSHGMKKKMPTLRRDAIFIVIVTLYGLILAAVIGNACVQIIKDNGYLYYPGSFETLSSNVFLYSASSTIPAKVISVPTKWLPRYSTILGETMRQPGTAYTKESGYQVLRLITELIPSAFAASIQNPIHPLWCLLGITCLVILAIAQFCAIWKPIATVLGANPSSALLSCVTGLLLGIPLSTETGIQIVYFLEVTIGGAWWLLIIWFGQILALFLIRGRPYAGDLIIKEMRLGNTLSTFIALSWNILIPIGLMFLCVFQYQVSDMNKFLHWKGVSYWPLWSRKLGGVIQITMLQIVPVTAVLQIYRFLSKGPVDILERIQLLYRPDMENRVRRSSAARRAESTPASPSITTIPLEVPVDPLVPDDVPPKYTPPPSYTTATGARIAKMLRQSIRRSVRRIMGEPGNSRGQRSNLSDHITALNSGLVTPQGDTCSAIDMCPPSYASVNIDLSMNTLTSLVPSITPNSIAQSITAAPPLSSSVQATPRHHLSPMGSDKNRPATSPTSPTNSNCVPNFLRPQRYLHSNRSLSLSGCVDQLMIRNSFRGNQNAGHFFNRRIVEAGAGAGGGGAQSRSLENLVLNSAAIGQSSAMVQVEDNPMEVGISRLEERPRRADLEGEGQSPRRGINKSRHNSTSSVI